MADFGKGRDRAAPRMPLALSPGVPGQWTLYDLRPRPMTSQPSPPVASDLGAQLRATAHEPDDDAASELRARLRQKMFGRGRGAEPQTPAFPAEPQMDASGPPLPLLGWIVPAVAVVALFGMSMWLHRARTEKTPAPARTTLAVLPSDAVAPEQPVVRSRPDPGPGLLAAATAHRDPVRRSRAIARAVQAGWADPSARPRLDATVALAKQMQASEDPVRALEMLRSVLDDLELHPETAPARALLLRSLAEVYDELDRTPAAVAARAEAHRLDPAGGSR